MQPTVPAIENALVVNDVYSTRIQLSPQDQLVLEHETDEGHSHITKESSQYVSSSPRSDDSYNVGREFTYYRPLNTSKLTDEYRKSRHFRDCAFVASDHMNASTDIDMYGWVADSQSSPVQSQDTPDPPDSIWPMTPFFGPEHTVLASIDEFEQLLQTAISWEFDETPCRLIAFMRNASPDEKVDVRNLISSNPLYANSKHGRHFTYEPLASADKGNDDTSLVTSTRDTDNDPDCTISGDNLPLDFNFTRSTAVRLILADISGGTLDLQLNTRGFWPSEVQLFCVAAIDADRYDYFDLLWTTYSTSFDRSNVRNVCVRAVQQSRRSEYATRILAAERDRAYVASDVYLWAVAAAQGNLDIVKRTPTDMVPLSCAAAAKAGNIEGVCILTKLIRYNRTEIMSSGTVCAAAAGGGHQECMETCLTLGWTMDAQTSLAAAANGHLNCLQYAVDMGCKWHEDAVLQAALNGHLCTLEYAHLRSGQQITEWIVNAVILGSIQGTETVLGNKNTINHDACRRYVCEHQSTVPSIVHSLHMFARMFTSK